MIYGLWYKALEFFFFFFADYIYFPLFGTKEIRFKHYFWIIGKKTFWVDYVLYRISFFLFLGCGAGVVSRIYYTIIFLGGGACLSAKGNRKTNSIFSLFLFLSIGGMKEIRLMICFIFLRLGEKKKRKTFWMDHIRYIYIHIHLPWLGAKEIPHRKRNYGKCDPKMYKTELSKTRRTP